jgi:hypothetical protein
MLVKDIEERYMGEGWSRENRFYRTMVFRRRVQ